MPCYSRWILTALTLSFSAQALSFNSYAGLNLNDYDELRTKTAEAIIEDARKQLATKYRDVLSNYRYDINRSGAGFVFLSEGGGECGGALKRDEEFLKLDYSQSNNDSSVFSKITWRGCIIGQDNSLIARDTVLFSEEIRVEGNDPVRATLSDFLGVEQKSSSQKTRGKLFKIEQGERSILREGERSFAYELRDAQGPLLKLIVRRDEDSKEERAVVFYRDVKILETVKVQEEKYSRIEFIIDPIDVNETDFTYSKGSRENFSAVVKKDSDDPAPLFFYHQHRGDRGYSYKEFLGLYSASITNMVVPNFLDRSFSKTVNLLPFTERVVEQSDYQRLINELELWQIRIRSGLLLDLTDVEIGELIEAIKNGAVEIIDNRQ